MAASKQFLLNYDSNILLPYTTLDCIIGDENESLDSSSNKGMDLITDNLLNNIKEFIYNAKSKSESENQITSYDISNAYVLGISTLSENNARVYTKLHKLTLTGTSKAGYYLGEDGTTHAVEFKASCAASDSGWYSTSINVRPSNSIDASVAPITADVSININVSDDCFDIVDGKLYSKYSDNAKDASVSYFSHYANKIAAYDASNGTITVSNIGSNNKPVYVKNGELTAFNESIGVNNNKPIYVNNGVITPFTQNVLTVNEGATIGSSIKPIYINEGVITPFYESVGNETTPVYLIDGVITKCTLTPSSITGADSSEGGTLYLQSIDGTKTWSEGNRTTKGNFTNEKNEIYYLVGIKKEHYNKKSESFECLTGAKTEDGTTGIYFKNLELFQTSDENLKTFTDEIDINFDNLATIKKGIYHWTDDPNKISDIGIGARSLEALYPEIVDENNGVKTVAYNRLGVIALAAIDKLHLRVKELETEMKELKEEIRTLKQGK